MSETRTNIGNAEYYLGFEAESPERSHGIDGWFELFQAQTWIDQYRVTTDEVLDIDATAEKIGVPVCNDGDFISSAAMITGIGEQRGIEPLAIILSARSGDKKLPFGHESGHLFLDLNTEIYQPHGGRGKHVEAFCEQFGRSMLLPVAELEEVTPPVNEALVLEIMEAYDVGHHVALVQLMMAGKLPRAIAIDAAIGEVPNPYYSNKVQRHIVCLDCELCKPHPQYDLDSLPRYDFTEHEWSNSTPGVDCSIVRGGMDHDKFRELNISYNRWATSDEALHENEKQESKEQRAAFAAGLLEDGYPEEQVNLFLPE